MNINIKLLKDYIDGKIIDEETLNALEDDYTFMSTCINQTNDKKLYNLCSENLKNNYEFIKFLMDKFSNDEEYIDKLLMYCLKNSKIKNTELNVNLLELFVLALSKVSSNELVIKYKTFLFSVFNCELIVVRKIISDFTIEGNTKILDMLMKGFFIIYNDFNSNKVVLDYISKLFLMDIINDNNIDIEELIHKNFLTYNDLNKYGINCFIIDYTKKHDEIFSNYLACNTNIINDVIDLNFIEKHWDIYNKNNEMNNYLKLVDEVHEYFSNNGEFILHGEDATIFFVARKFNILDKIKDLNIFYFDDIDSFIKDSIFLFEFIELSDSDKKHLEKIEEIFQKYLEIENKRYMTKDCLKNIVLVNKKNNI